MAQNQIRIDNIALWKPAQNLADGQFSVKVSPPGIQYLPKGSNIYQISTVPMYRYVKNYYAGEGELKVKYSLFVRTFLDSNNTVIAQLDAISETITLDQAKRIIDDPDMLNFEYLNKYIDEDYIPPEPEPEPEPEEDEEEPKEEEAQEEDKDEEEEK